MMNGAAPAAAAVHGATSGRAAAPAATGPRSCLKSSPVKNLSIFNMNFIIGGFTAVVVISGYWAVLAFSDWIDTK
jgi:hypothetical protein